jgi:hypothetical protein
MTRVPHSRKDIVAEAIAAVNAGERRWVASIRSLLLAQICVGSEATVTDHGCHSDTAQLLIGA